MDVDEEPNLSNCILTAQSFEIVDVEGNVSPAPLGQITDIRSNPPNDEQPESFESPEVHDIPEDEQILAPEHVDESEANLDDSDNQLQPVVLSVQGNIEMPDEHDETPDEVAPTERENVSSEEEENCVNVSNTEGVPEQQIELNEEDKTKKNQETEASDQEGEIAEEESVSAEQEGGTAEVESESSEQEGETAEIESESAEQEGESAEDEEAQSNDGSVQFELEADGDENRSEVESSEEKLQDQTEEVASNHAEDESGSNVDDADSPASVADLNESVFFSPNSNKSDTEAVGATDDTDSFKSTENDNTDRVD